MEKSRIFTTSFANIYPFYIQKAEKKGRSKTEVDAIICENRGFSMWKCEKCGREFKNTTG
jgi:hypothetical protein